MFQVLGLVVVRISRFRDDGDLKWIGVWVTGRLWSLCPGDHCLNV